MNIANVNEKEITYLMDLLSEIKDFKELFGEYDYYEIEKDKITVLNNEDFPILRTQITVDIQDFITNIGLLIEKSSFIKILLALQLLLDNCTDKDSKIIEYSSKIKKALELNNGFDMVNNGGGHYYYCGNCEALIMLSFKFCHECGGKIKGKKEEDNA